MGFVRWEVLLALAPLLGGGVALWRNRPPRTRRATLAWGLTGLAVLLAVFGVAGPRIESGRHPVSVLAVDGSASIGPRAAGQQRALLRRLGRVDCQAPCRIIRFGANANASPVNQDVRVDRTATNLQDGIAAAIGLAPPGGRVVVLSDGAQTAGDLLADVPEARTRRVQVSWIRPSRSERRDAAITTLALPGAVHRGDSVPVALTVHSTTAGSAILRVRGDGSRARSQTIRVVAGDTRLLLLYTAARRGWHSFQASVRLQGDSDPRNNSLSAVTDVLARPRVLVVAAPGSPVPSLLAKLGMRVRSVASDRLPTNEATYRRADALVLSDVPATSLSGHRVAALEDAVHTGGLGLLVLGGPHSFSLGRYARSPLEQILPVRSLIPGNLKRKRVAIQLVLDHSGSMSDRAGGVPKITMAREAARQTAKFIAKHDAELGVVDFDILAHTLVPLDRLGSVQQRNRVDKTIDGMQADGGTNIYAGLKAGYEQLLGSRAPQRHIILMTDGISDPEHYAPLLARLRKAKISVATVALGSDADRKLLARIAAGTGGHAYVTDNARELPKIFAKATKVSAKPVRVRGRLAVSRSSDSPIIRSLVSGALPMVRGNVVVTLKDGAQADLVASGRKSKTDPALAEWQIGQGRVVAWTPGVGGPWGTSWLAQKALWNDAIRWAQRGAAPPALTPVPAPGSSDQLEIDLSGAGATALGVSAISGTLRDNTGHRRAVRFTPTEPGTYTAKVAGLGPGVYSFSLASTGSSTVRATGEVAIPYAPEFSPNPASVSTLGELVRQTGGTIAGAAQADAVVARPYDLGRLLTLAALVCFLAGVAVRLLPGRPGRRRAGRRDEFIARRRRSQASLSGRSREADRAGQR